MEPFVAFSVEVDTTLIYPSPRGLILGSAAVEPATYSFARGRGLAANDRVVLKMTR
jgi:hypothetical protein